MLGCRGSTEMNEGSSCRDHDCLWAEHLVWGQTDKLIHLHVALSFQFNAGTQSNARWRISAPLWPTLWRYSASPTINASSARGVRRPLSQQVSVSLTHTHKQSCFQEQLQWNNVCDPPAELTAQPVIVSLTDTDIRGEKGQRRLSLIWKVKFFSMHLVSLASWETDNVEFTFCEATSDD